MIAYGCHSDHVCTWSAVRAFDPSASLQCGPTADRRWTNPMRAARRVQPLRGEYQRKCRKVNTGVNSSTGEIARLDAIGRLAVRCGRGRGPDERARFVTSSHFLVPLCCRLRQHPRPLQLCCRTARERRRLDEATSPDLERQRWPTRCRAGPHCRPAKRASAPTTAHPASR